MGGGKNYPKPLNLPFSVQKEKIFQIWCMKKSLPSPQLPTPIISAPIRVRKTNFLETIACVRNTLKLGHQFPRSCHSRLIEVNRGQKSIFVINFSKCSSSAIFLDIDLKFGMHTHHLWLHHTYSIFWRKKNQNRNDKIEILKTLKT